MANTSLNKCANIHLEPSKGPELHNCNCITSELYSDGEKSLSLSYDKSSPLELVRTKSLESSLQNTQLKARALSAWRLYNKHWPRKDSQNVQKNVSNFNNALERDSSNLRDLVDIMMGKTTTAYNSECPPAFTMAHTAIHSVRESSSHFSRHRRITASLNDPIINIRYNECFKRASNPECVSHPNMKVQNIQEQNYIGYAVPTNIVDSLEEIRSKWL